MSGSAKIQCFDDLHKRILSLEIAPGSDLDELRLSDHYGISRTQLRVFFQTAPLVYAKSASLAAKTKLVAKASDHLDAMISAIEAQESALAIDLTLQHWDLSRDRTERLVRRVPSAAG